MQHRQAAHVDEVMAVTIESHEFQFFQSPAFLAQPFSKATPQRIIFARDVRGQCIEQGNIILAVEVRPRRSDILVAVPVRIKYEAYSPIVIYGQNVGICPQDRKSTRLNSSHSQI